MSPEKSLWNLQARVLKLERLHHPLVWVIQIFLFALCGLLAFLIRFDFVFPKSYWRHFLYALPAWVLIKLAVFYLLKLDHRWMRYASILDIHRLLIGNFIASACSTVSIVLLAPAGFPRSIYVLDFLLCLHATSAVRVIPRVLHVLLPARPREGAKRVLIYGAGSAGEMLGREIALMHDAPYRVCGFVDDNASKCGRIIQGAKVLGGGSNLSELVPRQSIGLVLIAIPTATGSQMVNILERCHAAGVSCRTVPPLTSIVERSGLTSQLKEVAVGDLLGRTPVRLEEDHIRAGLEGKVVMVTGAAGSIGSELCRQIARFQPAGIVGFEMAESALFEIDQEMRQAFPETPFYPEIGSIQSRPRLDEVLRQYSPSVLYHAAAYKHVPLMEAHIFEAIENNVFGTYNVAVAAAEHGVEDFVMISSDKAVRPTNIMGATKRVAELVILGLQNGWCRGQTKYVAVRFGNVLGSNGSVIPIFKRQIALGGPVTVTHPDMRRFFMTIPEACQLVLQASAIGAGGQICVLDMGEPVKIVDLARNLILLSGLRPNEDIKIEFSGMRPGEKLYEELSTLLEDTVPTAHEKIRIYAGNGVLEDDMTTWLGCLREICEARDAGRLVVALKEIVPDYSPSAHLLKRVIETHGRLTVAAAG